MSLTVTRAGSVVRVSLVGNLGVALAGALHERLLAELDPEASVVVDASGLTDLDTSIAQLLLFVSRQVRAFRVESPAAAWTDVWTVLGLPTVSFGPG
jgi:anti-anti-sigma regulatory factor